MGFEERLRDAIVGGLQEAGAEMYRAASISAPRDTGKLVNSGFIQRLPDGVRFGFSAKHAGVVDRGYDAHPQNVRRHAVRSHLRRATPGRGYLPVKTYRRPVTGGAPRWYGPMRVERLNRGYSMVRRGQYIKVRAHYRGPFRRWMTARPGTFFFSSIVDGHLAYATRHVGSRLQMVR